MSAVTDQAGMQDLGVNTGDFDDDDGGGLVRNIYLLFISIMVCIQIVTKFNWYMWLNNAWKLLVHILELPVFTASGIIYAFVCLVSRSCPIR